MRAFILLALASCAFALSQIDLKVAAENDAVRLAFIDKLNSMPNMTWVAGFNPRFAGQSIHEKKRIYGVKPESKKILEAAIAAGQVKRHTFSASEVQALPTSFDSETNWPNCSTLINDIRDQSNCGCCWAFGAAEAASDRMCIATGGALNFPLSEQNTCFCASFDGCDGGDLYTPWAYIKSSGLVSGGQYNNTGPFQGMCADFSMPHCHHHGPQGNDPYPDEGAPGCPSQTSAKCPTTCGSQAKAPHNVFKSDKYTFEGSVANYATETDIMTAIMTDGPVEAAFTVYSDFENYVSGVYQHTSGSVLGGHAIKIVGWGVDNGVKYWKVANSWNPYWGENGYFRIIRGVDNCGIEDQVTASSTGAKWVKK